MMYLGKKILQLDEVLAKIEVFSVQLLAATMVGVLISQSILRYLFSSPLYWANEVTIQLMVIMTFIGLSLQIHKGKLIGVEFLIDLLPSNFKRVFILAIDILVCLVILILCFYFLVWLSNPETLAEVSPTTDYPRWYFYALIPFSLMLSFYHGFAVILKKLPKGESL